MDPKAVMRRHEASLRLLPNVVAVGVGPKVRRGEATGEIAIKVFVSRKVGLAELTDSERIPGNLEGIPTDVEQMAPLRAR